MALDPRLLRVNIEVNGQIRSYDNLAITASGVKFASPTSGECMITIANLEREVLNYIVTETSPYNANKTPKQITVEAGRVSQGYTLLYQGNLFRSYPSQPPDRILKIRALSSQFQKGAIVGRFYTPQTSMQRIAQGIADDLGLSLDFQADDKMIMNYSFSGAALKQLNSLSDMGDFDVFVDNNQVVVTNKGQPRANKVRKLSQENGLVGIPVPTETGVRVTFFYDSQTVVGSRIDLVSEQNPALTGSYTVYKLNYNLTNRDVPFYYTAECARIPNG